MDGFLLLDKPQGMTSFDVIRVLRRVTGILRWGHGGTLDPLATGLLVLAANKATPRLAHILAFPKTYEGTFRLGAVSTTYDADGAVTETGASALSCDSVAAALQTFCGTFAQVPPSFSAVKVRGKKAYVLARAGKPVSLKPREVTISSLELLRYAWPEADVRLTCSRGTYVRSLAHDLGQLLGCGAYVARLRRVGVGPYSVQQAIQLPSERAAVVSALLPLSFLPA